MLRNMTPGSRGGFTLIELLVVVSMIHILAATLFPVFAGSRAIARERVYTRALTYAINRYETDVSIQLMPVQFYSSLLAGQGYI